MLKRKSYLSLFFVGLFLLSYSFIFSSVENLDINIKDTYYVITSMHFYQFYSVLLLLLGLIYLIFDRIKIQLNYLLSLIHIYGTMILFLFMIYFNYMNSLEYQPVDVKYVFNPTDYNLYLIETLLAIIILQLLFIINIFVSIIKNCANSGTQ